MPKIDISICIATYKRPQLLSKLLHSISAQHFAGQTLCFEAIIVDNDKDGSAKTAVDEFIRENFEIKVVYDIEPVQNIALARNRSVALAQGEYIAFIDDDEEASEGWLCSLYECLIKYGADAVFGPVEPVLPENSPPWIMKGGYFKRKIVKDGSPLKDGRTGNVLIGAQWLRKFEQPFDPDLGLTGGEDFAFFRKIKRMGAKFCASENAVVFEAVEGSRLKVKWFLKRSFRGGQVYAAEELKYLTFPKKIFHYVCRTSLCCAAIIAFFAVLPFGRNHSVWWMMKFFSNLGQVSVIFPYRYREYKK